MFRRGQGAYHDVFFPSDDCPWSPFWKDCFFFGIATALGRVMSGRVMSGRVDALAMQERSNQTQRVEYYRGGGSPIMDLQRLLPSDCVLTTFHLCTLDIRCSLAGGRIGGTACKLSRARQAGFVREGGEKGYLPGTRERWQVQMLGTDSR